MICFMMRCVMIVNSMRWMSILDVLGIRDFRMSGIKEILITVSDKLWDKMKDADRVVFEKASDKVLGLVYYAEKRN